MQDTLILPASPTLERFESLAPDAQHLVPETSSLRAVRRILVPFDLSRSGVCALRIVVEYAERVKAAIHLLHVVRPADAHSIEPKSSRADDHLAEASERLLKHWVKRVVQGRVTAFVSIRIGDPVDVIAARASAIRADLIVMTSRSCSGIRNDFQRTAAERVSRVAPCPVLTIPEKCADEIAYSLSDLAQRNWQAVLLPVDFSTAAERAVRYAGEIANATGAKLLLAHGLDGDGVEIPFMHERLRSWAGRILNEAVPCHTIVWPGGHSLYAILSEAVRAEANLIVLPTSVQSWARRLRAGSITDGVLRQAPCPVLSVNETILTTEN